MPKAEPRAIEIMDRVPRYCMGFEVPNGNFAPHLQQGEIAVISADAPAEVGDLYLIQYLAPLGPKRSIVELVRTPLNGSGVCYVHASREQGRGLLDGPMTEDGWLSKCLGRVVGVVGAQPSFRQLTVLEHVHG